MMDVFILLCTYNGERFIEELLDSLLGQTYKNLKIIIRDDCSKDSTPRIIESYREKHPDKILVQTRAINSGGPHINFMEGLIETTHLMTEQDCLMLADQDDYWLPSKVEEYVSFFHAKVTDRKRPVLIFSDMTVVDERLQILNRSFNAQQKHHVAPPFGLNRFLLQNMVTGCTTMMNFPLLKHFHTVPTCTMHDHWIAQVAALFGEIHYLPRQLIYYRIHQQNVCGNNEPYTPRNILGKIFKPKNNSIAYEFLNQAKELLETYRIEIDENSRQLLSDYVHMPAKGKLDRLRIAMRHHMFSENVFNALVQAHSLLSL